jgi:hypothetical protein
MDRSDLAADVQIETSCRIKVEPMAPKVGPSSVRWRMTVDKETPGIKGVRDGEKWPLASMSTLLGTS